MAGTSLKALKAKGQLTWEALNKAFPDSCCTLDNEEPFRLCIRGILSAQCTDKRVNMVCVPFFEKYPDPADIKAAPIEDIYEMIKTCGLYKSKGKSIKRFAELYVDEWNREIPKDRDELMRCPGVGRKIANLILGEVYKIPAIVVDTHCKRTAYRIGLTKETEPPKVEKDLNKIFPEEQWIAIGHLLVDLGRNYCTAPTPSCESCPLNSFCGRKLK